MPKNSAGLLLWSRGADTIHVLLVHPGGPFWTRKDQGAWTLPKGEYGPDEDPLTAARREFGEELGPAAVKLVATRPVQDFLPLGEVRQKAGKWVQAFAFEGELDAEAVVSNTFEVPGRKGGKSQIYPEVDRAQWFALDEARRRINPAQVELLDRLEKHLRG